MAKAIQQERKGVQSGTWDHFLWKFLKPRQRSQVIPTVLTAKLTLSFMLFVCCSAAKSSPTLCDFMDCSTLGSSIQHYIPEFAQIHLQ